MDRFRLQGSLNSRLLFGVTLGYSLYEVAYGTGTPRAGAATMQTEEMHQQHQVINKAEAVTCMAA
jgi:hypothetical protein